MTGQNWYAITYWHPGICTQYFSLLFTLASKKLRLFYIPKLAEFGYWVGRLETITQGTIICPGQWPLLDLRNTSSSWRYASLRFRIWRGEDCKGWEGSGEWKLWWCYIGNGSTVNMESTGSSYEEMSDTLWHHGCVDGRVELHDGFIMAQKTWF